MRHAGIEFDEHQIWLFDGMAPLRAVSPAGKVPVLVDDGFAIWDTLAIAEYLAERHPDHALWPADPVARARARSVCAEMHSGFSHLRSQMPMNIEASLPGCGWNTTVQKDVDRICALIGEARSRFGQAGPFLFGQFSIADAFFAPVASRFKTYGVKLPAPAQQWCDTIQSTDAMRRWSEAALAERRFLPEDEPYRIAR